MRRENFWEKEEGVKTFYTTALPFPFTPTHFSVRGGLERESGGGVKSLRLIVQQQDDCIYYIYNLVKIIVALKVSH